MVVSETDSSNFSGSHGLCVCVWVVERMDREGWQIKWVREKGDMICLLFRNIFASAVPVGYLRGMFSDLVCRSLYDWVRDQSWRLGLWARVSSPRQPARGEDQETKARDGEMPAFMGWQSHQRAKGKGSRQIRKYPISV